MIGSAWASIALLASCVGPQSDQATLRPVGFQDLPGWRSDRIGDALPALLQSCQHVRAVADATPGWQRACTAAREVPAEDETAARTLLEQQFQPFAISNRGRADGLVTGYYEPQLDGARTPDAWAQTPLLARPADLVEVDLGGFAGDLAGRRIVGRIRDGALVPYWERAQIDAGALGDRATPILFLANPIERFFLQIQGSGRIRLRDGAVVRVGYAARNGRPYVAIGKLLVERGQLRREEVTMQAIRRWLKQHPDEAEGVMAANPSYVFFRQLTGLGANEGPIGTLGAALTPGRSIAVDPTYVPLGLPLWVDTTDPLDGAPLRRLMLAQDTGGAIKGAVRGDIFFGWGEEAEARAGAMQQSGRLYLLLPRP